MSLPEQDVEYPIKGELYSIERLEEYATYLGAQLTISLNPKITQPLLPRMRDNGIKLLASYRSLTEAIHRRESLPPAAEWLTDNFHIVEDQLREIQDDLPPAYYNELPKLAVGKLTGYPRIYAIALALVAHTDSQLEPDTIRRFIVSYQKVTPLRIGELWALAITLRLVLVENLRRVSVQIVSGHEQIIRANQFADHLLKSVDDKAEFDRLITSLSVSCCKKIDEDCPYLAQIAKRLRDQAVDILPALESLEKLLAQNQSTPEHVVHLSHQRQASNQVTVANIITSMRLLSSLNWREFFESISLVDRILEKDRIYPKMDFSTRDRYRHVIETIAKQTRASEIDISEKAVSLTLDAKINNPGQARRSHVGYYLIGRGRKQLHALFHYKAWTSFQEYSRLRPNRIYFGLLGILWAAMCSVPIIYSHAHAVSSLALLAIGFLALIPSSDLALSTTHLILTRAIRPNLLPKLDFSSGIPVNGRTMVVIPCMLSGYEVIQELLEKLEIHYLGNNDSQLFFALLTDFTDAATQSTRDDSPRLKQVSDGIDELNRKYPSPSRNRFYLFHRERIWNDSENSWMGWERKRGKIHEFNRLLRGATNTSFSLASPNNEFLSSIHFVITLDADTQLPRDSAHKLVGTIMHPLNEPHFDQNIGRVTEGYGILQPRIGVSLESASRSYFSKLFSGFTGIDPYTTAVSDIYQDLFREGSYTGKGLYDVDSFQAALDHRIPENTILSHDLFEGLYSRTGLITDVELLDDFPKTYRSYFIRQHRWIRGDWQIAAWISPFVRNERKEWTRNRLPLISRWKIFDNLRRSLVAPSMLAWLMLGWTVLPGSPLFWSLCALLIIALPILILVTLDSTIHRLGKQSTRWPSKGRRNQSNLMQVLLYIIFIPHQACVQLDAISRVFYRKWVSKRHLLEWTPAASTESGQLQPRIPIWQTPWPTELLLIATAVLVATAAPSASQVAIPLVLIWMSFPFVATSISRAPKRRARLLDAEGKLLLREIARRTWHYFETYVTQIDNWLPPDNHQNDPQSLTAHRTSPTNIGLYLLSLASARDFGFVSTPTFLRLLSSTLATLTKMEQYHGHYLNWYDTQTLEPLSPKYVSTVDSGNIAGYFLAVRQTCLSISESSVIDKYLMEGLGDIIAVIDRDLPDEYKDADSIAATLLNCRQLMAEPLLDPLVDPMTDTLSSWTPRLKSLLQSFEELKQGILTPNFANPKDELIQIADWVGLGRASSELAS